MGFLSVITQEVSVVQGYTIRFFLGGAQPFILKHEVAWVTVAEYRENIVLFLYSVLGSQSKMVEYKDFNLK